ncbi:hypothetical protein [Anaerosolibacter sp.]|uniref:hypothetical protein n=1 Tax=Anaerosolibacter sp. TaxID=1872527 RepID=UPI0039F0D8A1
MDLKNEKSKVYSVGVPITAIIAMTSAIVALITNPSDALLLDLQQLFMSAFMFLLGTQYVIAKKSKYGYFLYVVAVLNFMVLITRNVG